MKLMLQAMTITVENSKITRNLGKCNQWLALSDVMIVGNIVDKEISSMKDIASFASWLMILLTWFEYSEFNWSGNSWSDPLWRSMHNGINIDKKRKK